MASSGKFTGFPKGCYVELCHTHGTASARTSASVPGNMRFASGTEVLLPRKKDSVGTMPSLGRMRKNISFAQGESLVEASIRKHPHVELIDTCSGSTAYALSQNFAIVRHADRLDRTENWHAHPDRHQWPNDTPLSESGHGRATETGQALKDSAKPFGLIISSPYLRCAQTACRIAEVLKCPIQFDLDLGEVFDRSSMVGKVDGPQHRDPALLQSILRADFPDVVWVQDDDQRLKVEGKQQTWPESLDEARMRFCFKAQQSLQLAAAKLMSILIVTHGDAVGSVVGVMKKDWKVKHVPYASFALASRQVVVLEKGSTETKSDEPVYEQEWDMHLSPGLTIEEVHPCSRKRAYAVREHEIKKMNANTGELATPYFCLDGKVVESFRKVLNNLGSNPDNCGLLLKQASRARIFCDYESVIGEDRVDDKPDGNRLSVIGEDCCHDKPDVNRLRRYNSC